MTLFARLVLTTTGTGLAMCLLVAWRAYRAEASQLEPARRAVARPREVSKLEALEDVSFVAGDLRVRGWYQPARIGATVILGHGSGADRTQVLPQAAVLARHGFGVLLFDGPGHGESEGRLTGGEPEIRALRAAVALASARAPGDALGAFGLSLGGCVALHVAAEDSRLLAVAVDSAPADLLESLRLEYAAWGPVSYWPARLALWRADFDLETLQPTAAASRLGSRPLLVIGGGLDPAVPASETRRLVESATGPRELWIVPSAGHGDPQAREPAEYERRLVDFFHRSLRPAAAAAGETHPS